MGFWRKLFGIEERMAELSDTSGILEVSAELLRALISDDKFTAEQALEIPAFLMAVVEQAEIREKGLDKWRR